MARQTILFLDHTAMLGGGEIALFNLVTHLDKTRFEPVVLLCSTGPLEEKLRAAEIETHLLPLAPSVVHSRKDHLTRNALTRVRDLARVLGYSFKLARFLRRRRIDLLHTNSLKADIIGGLAARLAGVRVLWHVRDRIENDYLPPKVVRVFRWLCRILPHYVIANSQATLDTLCLPQPRGARRERGRVVHDGIALDESFTPTQSSKDSFTIGIVGRISPWKGQHIFLEAAAAVNKKFPKTRFQIIGSALFGEEKYEDELRRQATRLQFEEHVDWLGFRDDVAALIQDLDVLVHASTAGEPFGQVVIEGMAAGTPVIATRGGGVPEIIEDGVSGLLVPMNDVTQLAAAITRLLDDPALAARLAHAGRERVRRHFTIQHTARKTEQVYDLLFS